MYRVDLEHILKIYRSTIFMTAVYPEMYRDTVSMTIVDPEMYHDTALLVVSSFVSSAFLFLRLHARFSLSPVCVGDPDTSVSPEDSSQDSRSKSVQWRSESIGNIKSIGRHLVPRMVQRTLVKYTSLIVVDQVGNLALSGMSNRLRTWLSVVVSTRWNLAMF